VNGKSFGQRISFFEVSCCKPLLSYDILYPLPRIGPAELAVVLLVINKRYTIQQLLTFIVYVTFYNIHNSLESSYQ